MSTGVWHFFILCISINEGFSSEMLVLVSLSSSYIYNIQRLFSPYQSSAHSPKPPQILRRHIPLPTKFRLGRWLLWVFKLLHLPPPILYARLHPCLDSSISMLRMGKITFGNLSPKNRKWGNISWNATNTHTHPTRRAVKFKRCIIKNE